jgi:nucleoside-diphosphate-sugar epimerase
MKALVTGSAGFLGTRLIDALLSGGIASRVIAADVAATPVRDPRVENRIGTIADEAFAGSIVDEDVALVYHLAAVLSGQSEAEFDLGMRTNVDATQLLLESCRRLKRPARFIFTSSVAVFGGALPEVVPEDRVPMPQSSYGAEKAIGELLVNEYSRRGFIDGLACRLPTIAVRPGKPNSAVSSFVSGIIREPLAGVDSVCPVPLGTRLWISSPDVTIYNLVHASRVAAGMLGQWRVLNFPGLSVTVEEMLDSLERLGGAAARGRVRCAADERIMKIISTWPGAFDTGRALGLGFLADPNIDAIVRQFIDQGTSG